MQTGTGFFTIQEPVYDGDGEPTGQVQENKYSIESVLGVYHDDVRREYGLRSKAEMQAEFDNIENDDEKKRWMRQEIENRHNVTLDDDEIQNLLDEREVVIQPAPRDIIARFGGDAELLNAFTSWVSGASPFSNPESGPGLASTIGQFAGHAAIGFASGGGGAAIGKGIAGALFGSGK
jgi:hypothetical protein